jgi:hypothetical protein
MPPFSFDPLPRLKQPKEKTHRPRPFVAGRAGLSKPSGLPVTEIDVLKRRHWPADLVETSGKEGVEISFLDPDATAPALTTEAIVLEQPLCAPFVDKGIRHTDAGGNLFRGEHVLPTSPFRSDRAFCRQLHSARKASCPGGTHHLPRPPSCLPWRTLSFSAFCI